MTFQNIITDQARVCAMPSPIEVGQQFEVAGLALEVFAIYNPDEVILRDPVQGENRVVSLAALTSGLMDGSVQPLSSLGASTAFVHQMDAGNAPWQGPDTVDAADINMKAIKVMNQKMTWVTALKKKNLSSLRPSVAVKRLLKEVERERKETCPYTVGTLYRASLTLIKAGGSSRALQPKFDNRGGRGKSRLNRPVETILQNRIERLKAEPKARVTLAQLCEEVRAEIQVQCPKESVPSRPTIERRIRDEFSAYEWVLRTKGKVAANALFRNTYKRIPADAPLSVVQFDDTDSRLFLISGKNGLPYGRASITVGIDEYTGAPMGLDVSDVPRSMESAYRAFVNAVMPNNFNLPEFERVKDRTNYFGNPGLVEFDNALYNHAEEMEAAVRDMGCEVMYAKPRTPTEKPDVEYSFKILKSDFIPRLPGSLIGVDRRDQLKEAMDSAIMTVEDFVKSIYRWYYDEYANNTTARGGSPKQMWQEWFKDRPPLLPRHRPSLEVLMAIPQQLKFRSSGGLLRLGLRYNSAELQEIRRRCGGSSEIDIRYKSDDLTSIYVLNPVNKSYLTVPCLESTEFTSGLTNSQLKWIRKICAEKKLRNPDLRQLIDARNEMAEEVQRLIKSKKLTERRKGNRFADAGKAPSEAQRQDAKSLKTEKASATSVLMETWTKNLDLICDVQAEDEGWN